MRKYIEQYKSGKISKWEFESLLSEKPFEAKNFSGMDLSSIDLSGLNLFHADFSRTNLSGADLSDANAAEADFSGSNLTESKMVRTGFGLANFKNAVVFHSDLRDSTLTKADLTNADFRMSNLEDARILEADLIHTDFTGANMTGANLHMSNVSHSIFNNTLLNHSKIDRLSNFDSASWIGADIRDVNFSGAYLLRRFIMDQNYIYEFQTSSGFNKVWYYIWFITSDCGRSVLRWFLFILIQTFIFALIYTRVDIDFGPHETVLSPFYFSIVTMTTLGYGDAVPISVTAQIVTIIQVILGYAMLGGFLAILTDKIARRAD